MDPISFPRTPYSVSYYKDGQKVTVKRTPPPKLHTALPQDVVELTSKFSDDFKDGDKVEVKSINPRNPNVLQVANSDGETTFVPYFDTEIKEMRGEREGVEAKRLPINNRYLLWP